MPEIHDTESSSHERIYNKLVRDRIPEIIQSQGEAPVTRILSDGEYLACLNRKLREETEEYLNDNNIEELCDVLEVISALYAALGYSAQDTEQIRATKAEKNGAFSNRIFLEKVITESGRR